MRGRVVVALVLLAIGVAWLLDLAGQLVRHRRVVAEPPHRHRARAAPLRGQALARTDGPRYAAPVALIVVALLILLPPWPAWTQQEPWRTGRIHNEPRRGHLGPEDVAAFREQRLDAPDGTEYRGGELTAVFGSLDADLTRAKPPPDGARMKATSVLGGVKVRVPAGWRVSVHGTPVLGATVDRTAHRADGPTLDIEAVAVFGNVEVTNG